MQQVKVPPDVSRLCFGAESFAVVDGIALLPEEVAAAFVRSHPGYALIMGAPAKPAKRRAENG